MIFKESGGFQFPEAVGTSTAKESLRSTEHGSLQVLDTYDMDRRYCYTQLCKLNYVFYNVLSYKSAAGLSRFV